MNKMSERMLVRSSSKTDIGYVNNFYVFDTIIDTVPLRSGNMLLVDHYHIFLRLNSCLTTINSRMLWPKVIINNSSIQQTIHDGREETTRSVSDSFSE